jgi:hypothetical protein
VRARRNFGAVGPFLELRKGGGKEFRFMCGLTCLWRARLGVVAVMSVGLAFVFVGAARADTLGTTTPPPVAEGYCPKNETLGTWEDGQRLGYAVPPGGGQITQWSTNAMWDLPGQHLTFVVLRINTIPAAPVVGTVIATDPETLPATMPSNRVVSYELPTPVKVSGGEVLGLYSPDAGTAQGPICFWGDPSGRFIPSDESLVAWDDNSPPEAGRGYLSDPAFGPVKPSSELNVAATLAVTEDAEVRSVATKSATTLGNVVLLSSTVTDAGPGSDTITFTDAVPKGFAVELVDPGSGTCSTVGQRVTCTISGLVAGQSAPIDIVAKATAGGVFKNTVSVSLPREDTDPNRGNDSASTTLTVRSPGKCLVPRLKGLEQPFAVSVLDRLGCRPAVQHADRRAVKRGEVIRTMPGAGTYTAGRKVVVTISTGW